MEKTTKMEDWKLRFVCKSRKIKGSFKVRIATDATDSEIKSRLHAYLREHDFVPQRSNVENFFVMKNIDTIIDHKRHLIVLSFQCKGNEKVTRIFGKARALTRSLRTAPWAKAVLLGLTSLVLGTGIVVWKHKKTRKQDLGKQPKKEEKKEEEARFKREEEARFKEAIGGNTFTASHAAGIPIVENPLENNEKFRIMIIPASKNCGLIYPPNINLASATMCQYAGDHKVLHVDVFSPEVIGEYELDDLFVTTVRFAENNPTIDEISFESVPKKQQDHWEKDFELTKYGSEGKEKRFVYSKKHRPKLLGKLKSSG